MIFNPVRLRDNGFSEEMIHHFMATSYDASRPMGNVAIAKIENCLFGVLVGRYESVEPMLPRAVGWIDQAISIQENFGKNLHFYRSRLFHARGVASWMLDGVPHEGDWDGARVSAEAAWRLGDRVWTRHEIVSGGGLDDYMAYSWLAGADHWEAGMEMYEHWMGDQSKFSISGNLSPKKFVYALLLDATARQPSSQEKLLAAGRRMLRENLQENWLGGGQGIRAATWLQILYGVGEPGLTPSETLLRAYDDMPDVTSPF